MFFYDGVMAGGQMVKSACACLCCCICAGPILVIVGVVIIVSPNTRKDDVNAYNTAVADWKSGNAEADVSGWLPGTIGNSQATKVTKPVVVDGSTDDVSDPSIEVPFVRSSTPFHDTVSASYNLNNVDVFSITVTTSIPKTVSVSCQRNRGCSHSEMENNCKSRYSSSKYTGSGCQHKGQCGSCEYKVYIKDICAVASRKLSDPKRYIRDSSKESCNYPFTSTSFATTTKKHSGIELSLRTSDDPYIALQRITRGTNNFGLSKGQKMSIGFACLGVGVLLIICMFVFIFVVYKLIMMATGKNGETQGGNHLGEEMKPHQQFAPQFSNQYLPLPDQQNPEAYQQYQQPYQQYQQPNLQYPQALPATTYGYDGQPQTGYGSPPPPQVQPGYGYGYNNPQQQNTYNNQY
eukprot:Tbor_TRINITY_DN5873_c0_g2::TRINITY_DN5873_c0_g2_i4::g.7140::m.7140